MKKCSVFVVLYVAMCLMSCVRTAPIDLDNYQPSKTFAPAYEAFHSDSLISTDAPYDIEKTVRIMNAIEVAQTQSADFTSFLQYMAQQDCHGVAPEVLNAKARLLPVLQHMYQLQQANSNLDNMWVLAQCAGVGTQHFVANVNLSTITTEVLNDAIGQSPLAVLGLFSNGSKINEVKMAVFDEYNKQMNLKGQIAQEIDNIKFSYIDYLSEYAPIYHKYMKKWDALCLMKDKAYIDLYAGHSADAFNTVEEILRSNPTNREALLLRAVCLVNMASNDNLSGNGASLTISHESSPLMPAVSPDNAYIVEAQNTLSRYTSLYPQYSAPALVIDAMRNFTIGNDQLGMSLLNQASIEYPQQAAALTDMLDSYRFRSYLNLTPEGQYLQRLYRSTMEGYGIFSPNLQKALYYEKNGDRAKSAEEIYNHFFRRGNQGVYDCLLSDMEYCETHLSSSFHSLLMEHSYLDVNVKQARDWKLSPKDDEINVSITNRSDLDFENVRVFLCMHYTDMYKDEYDVVKTPSRNIVKRYETVDLGNIKLEYNDKKFDDITRIRAIAMTDDRICWIDQPEFKLSQASSQSASIKSSARMPGSVRQQILRDNNVDEQKIKTLLADMTVMGGQEIEDKSAWTKLWDTTDSRLRIEMPRVITLLNPTFSINPLNTDNCLMPNENILAGSSILLKFDVQPAAGDTYPLYIYSEYVNYRVTISFPDGKPSITNVEII